MKWYVIKNPQWKQSSGAPILKRGWGNGYVAIPPTHPAYKMDYDTLLYPIEIHGGLTYTDFGNGKNAPKEH